MRGGAMPSATNRTAFSSRATGTAMPRSSRPLCLIHITLLVPTGRWKSRSKPCLSTLRFSHRPRARVALGEGCRHRVSLPAGAPVPRGRLPRRGREPAAGTGRGGGAQGHRARDEDLGVRPGGKRRVRRHGCRHASGLSASGTTPFRTFGRRLGPRRQPAVRRGAQGPASPTQTPKRGGNIELPGGGHRGSTPHRRPRERARPDSFPACEARPAYGLPIRDPGGPSCGDDGRSAG
jgi:hypothetical protein